MVFLLNAERRPDSSLEACRTLKSVSLLRREAQTRFKPGLLGPGDVKLKRVTLKVRKMIEKLQSNWPRFVTCPSRIMGRPLMDLNETVMTSSLSTHHRPATSVAANRQLLTSSGHGALLQPERNGSISPFSGSNFCRTTHPVSLASK